VLLYDLSGREEKKERSNVWRERKEKTETSLGAFANQLRTAKIRLISVRLSVHTKQRDLKSLKMPFLRFLLNCRYTTILVESEENNRLHLDTAHLYLTMSGLYNWDSVLCEVRDEAEKGHDLNKILHNRP
jgi:hypothetical protein